MSSSPTIQKRGPPHRKRLKINIACQTCRSKKVKCDGLRPACSNCQKKDSLRRSCAYISPGVSDAPSTRPPPRGSSERQDGHGSRAFYGSSFPGVFAGDVTAAIDARLGLPSGGKTNLIPMTNAPLFGLLSHRQITDNSFHHVDNVLPPRKHADHLMDIYWRYIQPLEPFLEKERFSPSYQGLFAGTALDHDERIFLSSLNTIFALSTQLQESMQPEQREEASNTFFRRAWALLRPESIIWEPGSLELVECLLLMGRYLQCTNNPHQTWMAVGSAVRIAQSLGIHIPDSSSSNQSSGDYRRRRLLWQCCVFMDRQVSWLLGRTLLVSLTVSPADIETLEDDDLVRETNVPYAHYLIRTLEVYEIGNHILLSQVPAGSSFGDRLGLPRLYQDDGYFSPVVQLDTCLNRWEKSLPRSLRIDSPQDDADDVRHRQGVFLRLRILHVRLHLFRPILGRFCLSQPHAATGSTLEQGLGDRLSRDCASLCIDCAQKMIALIDENYKPDETIGIIPWWHRVFYLHVAGTILIAAMLRTDLFTPMVSESWSRAMSVLRAHEHLSPFIQQCVTTFQTLSGRILESHHPVGDGQFPPPEGSSNTYFQDVFQDIGFDPENFLFGKEDMSWLSNFEMT